MRRDTLSIEVSGDKILISCELCSQNVTSRIAPDYFVLPVADVDGGEPLVQYRERV